MRSRRSSGGEDGDGGGEGSQNKQGDSEIAPLLLLIPRASIHATILATTAKTISCLGPVVYDMPLNELELNVLVQVVTPINDPLQARLQRAFVQWHVQRSPRSNVACNHLCRPEKGNCKNEKKKKNIKISCSHVLLFNDGNLH